MITRWKHDAYILVNMSTIHTVFPAPEGLEVQILKGHVGTIPLPTLGCFVCQTSCLGTCIWSGFLDEAMRLAFTGLTNSFVAHLVSAALEPMQELPEWVHRFALPPDLQPRRSRRRVSVG